MIKLLLPLALLLVLLAIFPWLIPQQPSERRYSQQQPPAQTGPAVSPRMEPTTPPPTVSPPRSLKTIQAPAAENPPGVLEFELKEGLAVALGDVIMGRPEEEFLKSQKVRGYVNTDAIQPWPHPRIPYSIDRRIDDPKARQAIEEAIRYFNERTPVQWVPYEGQDDAVLFERGQAHCFSNLGRVGGIQSIRIVPECGRDEILHEMMHTLGFIHEHSRADRDQYVEVLWDNIDPAYAIQFKLAPLSWSEPLDPSAFDYHSIMIYDPTTFAKKQGLPTLRSKTALTIEPSRDGLSDQDHQRIRRLFRLNPEER